MTTTPHRPKLVILTTGGTIASRRQGPMASGSEVAGELEKHFPDAEVAIKEVFRIDSSKMTTDMMWEIGVQVESSFREGAAGVVVTHGTDTLEETAYFLDLMSAFFGPVAITGAMRGFDSVAPEGLANLVESCKVALEPASKDYGVLVVFNDKIHLAREATKTHSWTLDTFVSPETGPVGLVGATSQQRVRYLVRPQERVHSEYRGFAGPVDLVKTAVDSGDRLIRAALATGTKGIVVETLGFGHLPPGAATALKDAVSQGIPVVVTTRCLSGGAPNPGNLNDSGFITTDLSGAKARVKLMLALSVSNEPAELARLFSQNP
ncbi:MAG: asparaginase [Bacillota bacterium]